MHVVTCVYARLLKLSKRSLLSHSLLHGFTIVSFLKQQSIAYRRAWAHSHAKPFQDFMNDVAAECKVTKHHPEWTNIYNKTHIRWTTHNPPGLSIKDLYMARFCDEAGDKHEESRMTEKEREAERNASDGGNGRLEAGDCCTPKKT